MIHCIECGDRLGSNPRAERCRSCKAEAMYGWRPSEQTRELMVKAAMERQARDKGRPVISPEMVDEARRRYESGARYKEIAAWMGLAPENAAIYIKHGSWSAYRHYLRERSKGEVA